MRCQCGFRTFFLQTSSSSIRKVRTRDFDAMEIVARNIAIRGLFEQINQLSFTIEINFGYHLVRMVPS